MPFGGYKESGFGRDNGEEALLEYTQVKSVYYQLQEPKIWWKIKKIILNKK